MDNSLDSPLSCSKLLLILKFRFSVSLRFNIRKIIGNVQEKLRYSDLEDFGAGSEPVKDDHHLGEVNGVMIFLCPVPETFSLTTNKIKHEQLSRSCLQPDQIRIRYLSSLLGKKSRYQEKLMKH